VSTLQFTAHVKYPNIVSYIAIVVWFLFIFIYLFIYTFVRSFI